jgi:hypothetical protein
MRVCVTSQAAACSFSRGCLAPGTGLSTRAPRACVLHVMCHGADGGEGMSHGADRGEAGVFKSIHQYFLYKVKNNNFKAVLASRESDCALIPSARQAVPLPSAHIPL